MLSIRCDWQNSGALSKLKGDRPDFEAEDMILGASAQMLLSGIFLRTIPFCSQ